MAILHPLFRGTRCMQANLCRGDTYPEFHPGLARSKSGQQSSAHSLFPGNVTTQDRSSYLYLPNWNGPTNNVWTTWKDNDMARLGKLSTANYMPQPFWPLWPLPLMSTQCMDTEGAAQVTVLHSSSGMSHDALFLQKQSLAFLPLCWDFHKHRKWYARKPSGGSGAK